MNKQFILKTYFIILFALLIMVIGNINSENAWASSSYQTVPNGDGTLTVTPEGPDDGPSSFLEWLKANLGWVIGAGFCLLLSGGIGGGLIAWWIIRGGDEEEEDEIISQNP